MKRKAVEDVMGGEGAWDNVDRTDGELGFSVDHPSCERDRGLGGLRHEGHRESEAGWTLRKLDGHR